MDTCASKSFVFVLGGFPSCDHTAVKAFSRPRRTTPPFHPSFLPSPFLLPPVPAESRLLLSDLVPASLGEGRSLAVRVGAASILLHLLFAPPGFHADPTC